MFCVPREIGYHVWRGGVRMAQENVAALARKPWPLVQGAMFPISPPPTMSRGRPKPC